MRRLGHDCVALHYGTVLMAITTIDYEVTKERLVQNMSEKTISINVFDATLTNNPQSDPVS